MRVHLKNQHPDIFLKEKNIKSENERKERNRKFETNPNFILQKSDQRRQKRIPHLAQMMSNLSLDMEEDDTDTRNQSSVEITSLSILSTPEEIKYSS